MPGSGSGPLKPLCTTVCGPNVASREPFIASRIAASPALTITLSRIRTRKGRAADAQEEVMARAACAGPCASGCAPPVSALAGASSRDTDMGAAGVSFMGQSVSLTSGDKRGHGSLYLLYKERGCKEYAFMEEMAISAPLLPKTGRIAVRQMVFSVRQGREFCTEVQFSCCTPVRCPLVPSLDTMDTG